MRPPFPYFGGKMTIAPRIVGLMPPHQHYVEPYAGSMAVLLAKRPVKFETVNDIDGRLVTFWRVLREQPAELIRRCALTPHSRGEYLRCRTAVTTPGSDLETARRVWVVLSQGRGGALCGRKTGWKHYVDPGGSTVGMPGYLEAYVERMAPVVERLHDVSLECMPALELIAKYGQHADTLLYVDPPYLGAARAHDGREYENEMRAPQEHRALAAALHAARAAVVLSGYHSPLYDELYADWDRVTLPATTGNGAPGRQARTEVLWSNRPLAGHHQAGLFEVGGAEHPGGGP